ncbi:unnamed protein product [Paramecium primaurelia]|uniref:Uncharacterized protein n=1 Tax=Paramecium primaurelia TaxID=5886 RepID=A0A8S1LIL1_PARPR|nr:unnamed protein product [Paramecium primaurelia]
MSFTSIILQEQKKQRSFQIIQKENIWDEQKQRRKSCTCHDCGKLNQFQYKHMNVPSYIQQYSKIKTNLNHNFKSSSQRHISYDNIRIGINGEDKIFKCLHIQKKYKRQKSCDCQQCGMNSKFQEFSKSIKINIEKNKKMNRKQNLEQIFKGISPIRLVQQDDNFDIENNQNNKNICNLFNQVVHKTFKRQLVKPKKQINGGQQNRNILKSEQGKYNLKTNSSSREFGGKCDTNKKLNLPMVKSSYMKTIEILNIYEVQKYNPKFSNRQ